MILDGLPGCDLAGRCLLELDTCILYELATHLFILFCLDLLSFALLLPRLLRDGPAPLAFPGRVEAPVFGWSESAKEGDSRGR